MQRTMCVYALAASVLLTIRVPAAHGSTAHTRPAHDAGRPERVTACGVERWAVKTGIDPDARLVNQKLVVPTSIVHMRSVGPGVPARAEPAASGRDHRVGGRRHPAAVRGTR
jgi:hypothetical protein